MFTITNGIFAMQIIGAAAFALTGAIVGIRNNLDVFGVCIMGITTAVGGGVVRDVILGQFPPEMFINPIYALIGLGASLVIFIPSVRTFIQGEGYFITVCDAIGLGIFTVVGAEKALELYGDNYFLAIFVGVMTGVGGGLLRDIFSREVPIVFRKNIYATASIACGLTYISSMRLMEASTVQAMIISMGTIIFIRLIAHIYDLNLPKVNDEKE
ncbi:MAG: trimeric intracellular cation channel family protein [Eubacterium sp.]|nr:trimeric intracellular cation channel family protein [Candidatus Colimonas fimequi]